MTTSRMEPKCPRWAVRTKLDGEAGEYRIVADDSGLQRASEYSELIQAFTVGTPTPTAAGAADALPWAVIGAVDSSAGRRAAVVIQEWPQNAVHDRDGRRVSRTRYFDMPWTDCLETGFSGLYQCVGNLDMPSSSNMRFGLPQLNTSSVADYIEQSGFDWLAWTAATLMTKPIVLVGAAQLSITERLILFDAVFALLPHGFRAASTVATWSTSHGASIPNLSIGQYERDGCLSLQIGKRDLPEPPDRHSADYFERLSRVARKKGVQSLVGALWAQKSTTRAPEAILMSLAPLDRPAAALHGIGSGRGRLDELRALLTSSEPGSLDDDVLDGFARFLLANGVPEDLELLSQHWSPTVMWVLVDSVLSGEVDHRHAAAATRTGHIDDVLLAIFDDEHLNRSAGAVRFVAALQAPASIAIRAALFRVPTFAVRMLLTAAVDFFANLAQWIDYLTAEAQPGEPAGPAWLAPFRAILDGRAQPLERAKVEMLARTSPRAMLALLAVEFRFDDAVSVFGARASWGQLLNDLRSDSGIAAEFMRVTQIAGDLRPSDRASLDVLLALLRKKATIELPSMREQDVDAYIGQFGGRVDSLTSEQAECARVLVGSVLASLTVPALDFALRTLRFLPPPAQAAVYEEIARASEQHPAFIGHLAMQSEEHLSRLKRVDPSLVTAIRMRQLSDAGRSTGYSVGSVEGFARRAIGDRIPADHVLGALSDWLQVAEPHHVLAIVVAIADETAAELGPKAGEAVLEQTLQHAIKGGYGYNVADAIMALLPAQIRLYERRLDIMREVHKSARHIGAPPAQPKRRILGRKASESSAAEGEAR